MDGYPRAAARLLRLLCLVGVLGLLVAAGARAQAPISPSPSSPGAGPNASPSASSPADVPSGSSSADDGETTPTGSATTLPVDLAPSPSLNASSGAASAPASSTGALGPKPTTGYGGGVGGNWTGNSTMGWPRGGGNGTNGTATTPGLPSGDAGHAATIASETVLFAGTVLVAARALF